MSSRPTHTLIRQVAAAVLGGAVAAVAADPTTRPVDAAAAPVATTVAAASGTPDYPFTLGGFADYSTLTDLHDGNGSFSVFRTGGSIAIDHKFTEGDSLEVTLDGAYSHYFFRDIATVPGADGHDSLDVYELSVAPTFTHFFSPDFGVYGGVSVTASGQAEVNLSDALSYGAFAGVTYKLGDGVWVGAGVGFTTQLEDSAFVIPLITVNWDISPRWNFSTEGPSAKLTYKLDNAWSVYAKGEYAYRQFRLASTAVLNDGVLTDQSVPITVGVTYTADDQLSFSAEVGVVAYRRLEFRDGGGDQVGADEADPAAFVSIQGRYSF